MLRELADPDAPLPVQSWIASPPDWVEVAEAPAHFNDASLASLDDGEKAAITLAALHPELLLLMDDREGVIIARKKGLHVTGTIGVLDMASRRDLLDLAEAFKRLRSTTFRCPEEIMTRLLNEQNHRDR